MDVHYFARYREALGLSAEVVQWDDALVTLDDLRRRLVARGGAWCVLDEPNLMCAINQELCHLDAPLGEHDEVAFFPPVTGG